MKYIFVHIFLLPKILTANRIILNQETRSMIDLSDYDQIYGNRISSNSTYTVQPLKNSWLNWKYLLEIHSIVMFI